LEFVWVRSLDAEIRIRCHFKNRVSSDEEAYSFKAEIDEVIGAANLEETALHSERCRNRQE